MTLLLIEWRRTLTSFIVSSMILMSGVRGHGRLIEPPSRSSMWRFGFSTDPNYNDNELFCGGFTVQFQSNGGKCGICGDAYHLSQPRPNEAGGKYGKGIIVKRYNVGETINVVVELTANHRGFFEFKLCPNNNPKRIATQECLDQYPLVVSGTQGDTRYYVPNGNTGKFPVDLDLPDGLTCSQCVLQWTYTAGNNWGTCEDGTGKLGCGNQETFRGCADVSIGSSFIEQEGNSQQDDETNNVQRPVVVQTTSRPRRPIRPYFSTKSKPKPKPTPTNKPISFTPRPRPVAPESTSQRPKTTQGYVKAPLSTVRPSTWYYYSSTTPRPVTWWSYATPSRTSPRPTAAPKLTSYYIYVKPTKTTKYSGNKINTGGIKGGGVKGGGIKGGGVGPKGQNRKCRGVGIWKKLPGINGWCEVNCAAGYCPPSHCKC